MLAHNSVVSQVSAPSTTTTTTTTATNTAATAAAEATMPNRGTSPPAMVGTWAGQLTPSFADVLQDLGGLEFMAHLVGAFKASLNGSTVGAEDNVSPVNNFVSDTASLQDQIQAINENGASSTLVTTFDDVKVTGMSQGTQLLSLFQAIAAIYPSIGAAYPKDSFGDEL